MCTLGQQSTFDSVLYCIRINTFDCTAGILGLLVLSLVTRLRESCCTVLFDVRVQLGAADGLRILFLLAAGSQQPFTARLGPKFRQGADRKKLVFFLQDA